MTAHELAYKLLEQEDIIVYIPVPNTKNDVQEVKKLSIGSTGNPYETSVYSITLAGDIRY